jgi:hypothetical protein
MDYSLIENLEADLANGTIELIDFVEALASRVFSCITDRDLHDYLIEEEGYFDSTKSLYKFFAENRN